MSHDVCGLRSKEPKRPFVLGICFWHLGQPAIDDKSTRQDGLERFSLTAKWRPNLTRLTAYLDPHLQVGGRNDRAHQCSMYVL